MNVATGIWSTSGWLRIAVHLFFWFARMCVLLIALQSLAFLLFDVLPAPEFRIGGMIAADQRAAETFRAQLGLQGTRPERYLRHLRNLTHGDLGLTLSGTPVADVISQRLRTSLPHVTLAVLIVALIPIPLATLFFRPRETGSLRLLYKLSDLGWLPAFLAAVIVNVLFSVVLMRYLPGSSDRWRTLLLGFCGALLPASTLFSASIETARELYQRPFVSTYRALGLSNRRIARLLTKNLIVALSPMVGRLALGVLLGTVFAEVAFDVAGFGRVFAEALRSADYTLIAGWLTLTGTAVLALSPVGRPE